MSCFFVLLLTFVFTLTTATPGLADDNFTAVKPTVSTSESHDRLVVSFDQSHLSFDDLLTKASTATEPSLSSTGMLCQYGKPILPMVSRFVIVPPEADLRLEVNAGETHYIPLIEPPAVCQDQSYGSAIGTEESDAGLYPAYFAEMSKPFLIRGVRIVKLTTYPVQYDQTNSTCIYRPQIQAEIVTDSDSRPVNPSLSYTNRHYSRTFHNFIKALTVNGESLDRDTPDDPTIDGYLGHYLVVTHSSCLQYTAPLIEWKRKSGYRVDILSFSSQDANNEQTVKNRIQNLYNSYLNNGEEPFEYILLVGDRTQYSMERGHWILDAYEGMPVWQGVNHADFLYGCLEGDDDYPDVAVGRFISGDRSRVELAVGRTLAYEAEPDMNNTAWFNRAGVFSQHWGNTQTSAWHVSIHTNVRWAEELFKRQGFDEVRFFESYAWDQNGSQVGPFEQNLMNDGASIMAGRAEDYYFAMDAAGVRTNTKFPIRICLSGHGETAIYNLFRNGSGAQLKGIVAGTYGWNVPPTAPFSAVWLEMVRGHTLLDLPLGWARNLGIVGIEQYFPNFDWATNEGPGPGRQQDVAIYDAIKTDIDCLGDPSIQYWRGTPLTVSAEYDASISPNPKYLEVQVIREEDGENVPDAFVTFYAPGNMPAFSSAAYATYNGMVSLSAFTDARGIARLVFLEGTQLAGNHANVTVTGRNIRPYLGQIQLGAPGSGLALDSYRLFELQGNGDGDVNPGERFGLTLAIRNCWADRSVEDGVVELTCDLPYIQIARNSTLNIRVVQAGSAVVSDTVILQISVNCPHGETHAALRPLIHLALTGNGATTNEAFFIESISPDLEAEYQANPTIIPTDEESHNLNLTLRNIGGLTSPACSVQLTSLSRSLNVEQSVADIGSLRPNETARLNEPFVVSASAAAIPGLTGVLQLVFLNINDAAIDTALARVQIGEPEENCPQMPDAYGYVSYDNTDVEWEAAPEYDWIEISQADNDRDLDGERLAAFDGSSDHSVGESTVINLPFETQFYGEVFDRITVCTNGYICLGAQERITNFQNWPMDRPMGGGMGMIAPFWDWLRFVNGSNVYTYYDENLGRFIIEWYRLRHKSGSNTDLTFELILLDRARWETDSGDQDLLFQYRSISQAAGPVDGYTEWECNVPFASVGISSPDGTTGVNYTFANQYPVTSAELTSNRAILFTTSDPLTILPTRFSLVSPADQAILDTIQVSFSWERSYDPAVMDEVAYTLNLHCNGQTYTRQTADTSLILNLRELGVDMNWLKENSVTWWVDAAVGERVRSSRERFSFQVRIIDAVPGNKEALPANFGISSLYPNPFNGQTEIVVAIVGSANIAVDVYDLHGRMVKTVYRGVTSAGWKRLTWDADDLSAGVYLIRLYTPQGKYYQKAILVK